ncbi:MarR family winged helix-turn-helix transcriptional regulator [Pseudodonghicola flavimaris]|uniref:MarR family transcriptional regulator n=1 Tax=Pseudodonghicola flavimaris TaxID=3050036 RepID=A0ABT7EVT2_9RHOB|nr:MarR family transcriptional regulator [Pseudodonghicola flavimaris]MDK3016465.1 MarR family transcriptional regulator [Pseudodonghicola flavimaris]
MQDREHDSLEVAGSDDLGRLIPAVGQSWRRVLGQRLSNEGLSDATAMPILVLWRAQDIPMRQNELAQQLGLETSGVVRLLDTLATRGLVRRIEDPTDRRAKLLELTDDGIALGARADRIARALRRELLAEVTAEELTLTMRLLHKLSAVLETC